ncbi:hypothetical protein B0H19DRAFT_1259245 [Mycena capillaripes]|nr:hypothetical protein B0H19DRAFT_1259245 [Mycena capillaripes]
MPAHSPVVVPAESTCPLLLGSNNADRSAPYLSGHDICHHPDLHSCPHPSDLRQHPHPHPHHPAGDFHPPEFSSAFGLVNLDDSNVLAGLASDGVPSFSTAAQGRTEPMRLHEGMKAGGGGRMWLIPPEVQS